LTAKTTAGWGLRRGMYVHDLDDPIAYLEMAKSYTLRECAGRISCPTLVCTTDGDDVSARSNELAASLRCAHLFVTFRNEDGVHGHCQMTGRAQFNQRAFDWLDEVLNRVETYAPVDPGPAAPLWSSLS
jgi:hypothetical protein